MMSDTSFIPGPETLRAYREALGCFGTGVTVVTTNLPGGPVAMTANSFASVSLDPPLVLWCPAKSSERHDLFTQADGFAIHVMAEDQHALATRFARSGDAFEGLDWTEDGDGLPELKGSLARFSCRHEAVHPAGDHSILVGRVVAVTARAGQGLMFKRGRYGGFAGLD